MAIHPNNPRSDGPRSDRPRNSGPKTNGRSTLADEGAGGRPAQGVPKAGLAARLSKDARREQLLDVAARHFASMGYARATTAGLAKAAGVTEPIIYRHFRSKKHLFIELVRRAGERTVRQWEQRLAHAKDPAQRLVRLLGENPMVSDENRDAYRVLIQAITEMDDAEIRKVVNEHVAALHSFLTRELARAREEHKIAGRFSPEIIAWLLIHNGLGFGTLSALGIQGHGVDQYGTTSKDVIARLLVGKISGDGA